VSAVNTTLYENLNFNFIRDIAPVASLVQGPRQQLRFSKTGDPNLEAAYATQLIRPGQRGHAA
jgi:hypothetical protein